MESEGKEDVVSEPIHPEVRIGMRTSASVT
jgi:hypothetical protein